MSKIKVGSDFSGIGALNAALKRLGVNYVEVFACDMDKYARRTFLANNGNKKDLQLVRTKTHDYICDTFVKLADGKEVFDTDVELNEFLKQAEDYARLFSFYYPFNVYHREIPKEPLDLYVTTPPCQGFSMAGKREGSILFLNSHHFIKVNKPSAFVFENDEGLISHDKIDKNADYGRTFNQWLNYLGGKSINGTMVFFPDAESVPYHIYHMVLNAKEHNIPQNRKRVFIVGIRDDKVNNFRFPSPEPLKTTLKDILEPNPDPKYYLPYETLQKLLHEDSLPPGPDAMPKVSKEVRTEEAKAKRRETGKNGFRDKKIEFREQSVMNTITTTLTNDHLILEPLADGDKKVISYTRDEKGKVQSRHLKDVANTIHSVTGGGGNTDQYILEKIKVKSATSDGYEIAEDGDSVNYQHLNSKTRRARVGKGISQTLDTTCTIAVYRNHRIRRLMPIECIRLMDFPKDFKIPCSDTQTYKQAGNSIPVGVLSRILERILSNN